MLKVYTAEGEEWVVAESAKDAAAVYEAHIGEPLTFGDGELGEWAECPPDKPFTVTDTNWDPPLKETHTFAEWAAIKGRGYLASATMATPERIGNIIGNALAGIAERLGIGDRIRAHYAAKYGACLSCNRPLAGPSEWSLCDTCHAGAVIGEAFKRGTEEVES